MGSAFTLMMRRSLKYAARSRVKRAWFLPDAFKISQRSISSSNLASMRQFAILKRKELSTVPVILSTSCELISLSPPEIAEIWSRSDKASRKAPSDLEAMRRRASSVALMPDLPQTSLSLPEIRSSGILLKSYLWHLEMMVAGILSDSVVAKMKITCFGGSSIVLRRALNAPLESMWTSSMM